MATYEFTVCGRVQGVGYRYFAIHAAANAGVTGYVRNLPDGAVQVVASGSEEALEELEQRLRRGPVLSRVTEVRRVPLVDQEFDRFEVRY